MSRKARPLNKRETVQARMALADGASWREVGALFGMSYTAIRRQLDPVYRARHNAMMARRGMPASRVSCAPIRPPPGIVNVPHQIEIEREQRACSARSLTAELMGDPPPGYSALDHKRAARDA